MPLRPAAHRALLAPDTAPAEVTLRQLARATGKKYSTLQSRRVREGWPSRADPRLDDSNRAGTRRLYRVTDLPADIRSILQSKQARRRPLPPPPPAGERLPRRKPRKFLELRA